MEKISITLAGRTVFWEITPEQSAYLAQSLIAALGPADEED